MESIWSRVLGEAIGALAAGEAGLARELFQRLESIVESYGDEQTRSLSSAWDPFVRLLGRRGYFVRRSTETRVALDEIHAMGPGFDLYDLAASLSRCDVRLARHLKTPSSRAFPELRPFSPSP